MKILGIIAVVIVALVGIGLYTGAIDLNITKKGHDHIRQTRGKAAEWIQKTGNKASEAAKGE